MAKSAHAEGEADLSPLRPRAEPSFYATKATSAPLARGSSTSTMRPYLQHQQRQGRLRRRTCNPPRPCRQRRE